MSSNRFTKLLLLALSVIFLSVASPVNSIQAQIIQLDLTGIDVINEDEGEVEPDDGLSLVNALRYVEALQRGKAFWDARILGYSNKLPRDVQSQLLGNLTIFSGNDDLDPGVLGEAGLVDMSFIFVVRGNFFNQTPIAVGQFALLNLDNQFIVDNTTEELVDVAIHEFAHALGLGTLWAANGLLQARGLGPAQYVGENARAAFAVESGRAGLAQTGFVPTEIQGGPGTAFGHWDDNDPFFNSLAIDNRIEVMTGFMIPNSETFVSNTTLAQFVDLHYVVAGFNEGELIPFADLGDVGLGIPSFGSAGPGQIGPIPIPSSADDDEDDAGGGLTANGRRFPTFSRNPAGANPVFKRPTTVNRSGTVNQSGAAASPRPTFNIYKKRRR